MGFPLVVCGYFVKVICPDSVWAIEKNSLLNSVMLLTTGSTAAASSFKMASVDPTTLWHPDSELLYIRGQSK
jgi:hypothetical protein